MKVVFEPWRKSHTGNIYGRIFYKEKNSKWYPIDVLRNIGHYPASASSSAG